MQPYPPFFPHIPPPPIPSRETIINEGLKILQQPKLDQEWLKNWIERKKPSTSNRITISFYRQKLIEHARLLQQYENALKIPNHELLLELKVKIEQSNQLIYNSDIVVNIQKQIQRRKSKRARLRRQKEKQSITNTNTNAPCNEPNNIPVESRTNEKSLTEKIKDIESILHTIEQLKQLRHRRQPTNVNNTDDQLTEIQNLCIAKLNEYKGQIEPQVKSSQIELFNYLFNNNNQSFYESTNPDTQYYLRAHENLNNLIEIRQAWDQYSTTRITSSDNIVPFQWYEPRTPCDTNWSQYIFNKKT